MRKNAIVVVTVLVSLLIAGFVSLLLVGIKFGSINCTLKYFGEKLKCGLVKELKSGNMIYVVKVDSVEYFNKGFKIDYFYGLNNDKWWSKYIFLKGKAIFSEDENYLIKVVIVNKPVVNTIPDTIIYEESLTANGFKELLLKRFNGEIRGGEVALTLFSPVKFNVLYSKRVNKIVQIIIKE